MKVAVKVKNLLKAVNICSRLVNNRNSLEILGNILIETNKNTLKLSSTNLDLAITTNLGAKVEKEGKVSVPARLFSELINSISEDTLQIISDETKLTIKGDKIFSRLNGVSASEFPSLPQLKNTTQIKLESKTLKNLIDKVLVSVSIDESRPVLAGVYFNIDNQQLTMAATDSYRLSEVNTKVAVIKNISCIIPARTVIEIQRLISAEEVKEVEFKISESEASFKIGDSELISQLTDGKYPDYKKIIPTNSATSIICDKAQLIEAVKISSVFARESSHSISLVSKSKELTINAQTSEVGENVINLPIQQKGKDSEISINAKYLSDILNVINNESILIELNDKLDPMVVRPEKGNEIHIIMPLRS